MSATPQRTHEFQSQARARLARAFIQLTDEHHFTIIGAARALGVSPSAVSGKDGLPARFKAGGLAALAPKRAAFPAGSKISRAAERVAAGVVFDGVELGGDQ